MVKVKELVIEKGLNLKIERDSRDETRWVPTKVVRDE